MRRRARKKLSNADLAIIGYRAARRYWNASHPERKVRTWKELDAERSVAWIEAAKAIRAALAGGSPGGGAV